MYSSVTSFTEMIHSDCFYQMSHFLGKKKEKEFELNEQNLQNIFKREVFGGTKRLGVKEISLHLLA